MDIKLHTPSAGGVIVHNGKVLIIYSALRNAYAFPKGTIDDGETIEVAALREVKEETGYNVEIVKFLDDLTFEFDDKNGTRYRKTVTYFLMKLADTDDPKPNLQPGEDFVNMWVPVDDAEALLTFDDSKEILRLAL